MCFNVSVGCNICTQMVDTNYSLFLLTERKIVVYIFMELLAFMLLGLVQKASMGPRG